MSPRRFRLARTGRILALVALIATCLTFGDRTKAQGPPDFALDFDGVNDYVTFGPAAGLGAQSFTLELWFMREGPGVATGTGNLGLTSAIPLVTKGRGEAETPANLNMNYFLGIDSATGRLVADFEDNAGGVNHPVTGTTPVVAGRWNHAAATYDAATGRWRLYLNGVQDTTLLLSSPFVPESTSIQHAAIGSAVTSASASPPAAPAGFFNGRIDEVRIWNVVRSLAEIQAGMGVEISQTGGLIGRWGLDDGAGTTATDTADATPINGTLTNGPLWVEGAPFQNVAGAHGFDFIGTLAATNYVALGQAPGLGATTFTLEAWIKREGAGTTTSTGGGGITNAIPILAKGRGEADPVGGSTVDTNYFLGLNAATNVLVADYEEGAGQTSPSLNHPVSGVTPILPDGNWHHVAATFNGTTWRLYVDGVEDGSSEVGPGRLPRSDSIQHAAIGTALQSAGANAAPIGLFDGAIDEARIWNYARGASEILSGKSREIQAASGLLGRWNLDELTQNGNTFTVTNGGSAGGTGTVIGATATAGWSLIAGAPFTEAQNAAPVVTAGTDQGITLPASASLQGSITTDDGVPAAATVTWSKISGPGTVTFGNASQPNSSASFSVEGTYVLRLTATDGELTAFDEVTVTVSPAPVVNQPPNVNAGTDQTIALPAFASLNSTVTDDGLPAPPALTTSWSPISGPGTVTFGDPNVQDTTATFSATGTYVLQITANDGQYIVSDEVMVTVNGEGASALDFVGTSGSNAYVALGNPAKLRLPEFTVETWFRRDGTGVGTSTGTGGIEGTTAIPLVTRGRGLGEATATDLNYFLGIDDAADVLAADFEEGATGASPSLNHPVRGVTPITNGVWHHAAATYDGGKWQLFLDGQLEAELVVNQPPAAAADPHVSIGSSLDVNGTGAAGFFNGAIDEVRIWDRALALAEIQAQINTQLTSGSGLVARWGLNEGSGTTVFDSITNPATGTIVGSGFSWTSNAPFNINLNPPTVTNPGNQGSAEGDIISLQVAASEPDPGQTLTYSASNLPGGLSIHPTTGVIAGTVSFTAAAGSPYSVTVTVTDNGSPALNDQAAFTWAVTNINRAPNVANPGNQSDAEIDAITLAITASDPDGDAVSYAATNLPPGLTIHPTTGVISGSISVGASANSPYAVTITVSDNFPPPASSQVMFDWVVALEGQSALDFDGTNAYVALGNPSKLHLSTFTVETWFRRDGVGTITSSGAGGITNAIPLVARGRGEAEDPAVDLNYFLGIDNTTGVLAADFEEGAGGTNPSLNHPVFGVTPITNGEWHHAAATYNGTTWQLFLDGQLEAELVVNEPAAAAGNQHASIGSALQSNGANPAPVGLFDGAIDEVRIWNRALTQAEIQANVNAQLTSGSGLVGRWGLNEGSGNSVFDATANPATGTIIGAGFTWTSSAPFDLNFAPAVTNPGTQTNAEGQVISLPIVATDANPGQTLAYSAINLPAGLSIDAGTGLISGTISATATTGSPYSVVVTVTDNGTPALNGEAAFTWNVTDLNQPPALTNPGSQSSAEGATISLQIVASDPDLGQTLAYSASNLPGGLTINATTGEISGTIAMTAAAGSPYTVILTATDDGSPVLNAQTSFTWNVSNTNQAPVVVSPGNQNDSEGDFVTLPISASDPDSDAFSFGATGLPPGLSIHNTTGSITGTIGAGAAAGSPYSVIVTVTDIPHGASNQAAFTWNVAVPAPNFALDFDGTNDHVSFASSSTLGLATFTIEAWINRQGPGVGTTTGTGGIDPAIPIVTKGTSEADNADNLDMNYFLGLNGTTGVLIADFEEGAGGTSPSLNHPVSGTAVIPLNTWTHVAATYDGTWRLYVNGVLDGTLVVNQPPRSDSVQPFGIGTAFESDLSPEGFFNGLIDEVRVWDHARTAQEILDDLDGPLTTGSGLVARWGFNEGSNTALNDSVGAVHGVVQNGAAWVSGTPFTVIAAPSTVSFRDGVNGFTSTVDTHIRVAAPSTSHGLLTTFHWDTEDGGTPNSPKFGLLRFDNIFGSGPGQIPIGSTIQSATLSYTVTDVGDSATVNEVAVGWLEDVTFDGFGAAPGVQAGDFGALVGTASGAVGVQTLNVTASLAAWSSNPTANRGWIFRPTATDGTQAFSGDHTTTAERPLLTVTFTAPSGGNAAPIVNAGTNQAITFPAGAALDGTVSDDGLPSPPATVTTTWSKVSGPGTVTFGNANAVDTTASFSAAGTYVLRLTANDGAISNFDDVTIAVSVVGAGSAVDFGGSNAYMSIASPTAMGASTFTLEAWINRQGAGVGTDTGANGFLDAIPIVTKGTSQDDPAGGGNIDMNYFLGIDNATGMLAADFEEASNGSSPSLNHPVSGTSVIPMNAWTHIAATYDGTWRLYVNGVLETTLAVNQPARSDSIQPFAIGSALVSTNVPEGFFNGVIDEVRVWNVARTEAQIQGSMSAEIATAPNLIGRWSFNDGSGASVADSTGTANGTLNGTFAWVAGAPLGGGNNLAPDQPALIAPSDGATGVSTPPTLTVTVSDPDNDPLNVTFHGRRASGTAQDFTIVALPDTQHYVDSANFPIFTAQTQWVVDNRDALNVVFTTQLGDITEHGDAIELEWQRADASMDVLDNNGIPNSVVPGNHDLSTAGVGNLFDQYFPPSRYLGTPWYAGYLGSDPQDAVNRLNKNNYNLFSVDGLDFILINLEYDMPAFAVTWANRILQEHPNRRAIISTHMFINASGGRPTSPYNRPDGLSAEAVWQQLVFPNCNVFLVLNGHYHGEARRNDPNSCGQPVHQLNADYQDFQNGGDGWLRYHIFKPSENKIYVYTFSPTRNNGLGEFDTDAQSQFVLDYDMQGTAFNVIGSQSVTSGSPASIQWPGLFEGRQYEWFATVNDGIATTTGPTWSFTTPFPPPPSPPSGVVATVATFSSINVTWTDNSSNEETFVIERSINGGLFNPLATVSANTTARLDTGLSGSTAYCYRVAASNAGGASVFSPEGCATTPVAPQSRTFQDGAGGYTGTSDTHIKEGDPATAFGTLATFGWDGSEINNLPTHGLIRFDSLFGNGAGQVPVGSQIVSATLTYVVFEAGDSANVHEALVNWSESDTFDTFGGEPGVQANEIGALVGSASASIGVRSLDVTSSVAAWAANPSANRGWIFQPTNSNGADARSSEYGTVAERPILTILYDSLGPPNAPPDQPVLIAPADGATGVSTPPTLAVTVSDQDNNLLTVGFHGRRVSGTAQDFTIVALPDTQHYVDSANFPIFTAQTQWVVNNSNPLNIVFTTQLGDIVQNIDAVELEWQRADASMDVLDNNGIPNSVVPGNHDLSTAGVGNLFDQYFPPSRYLGTPWYAGYLGSDPQDAVNRLNKNNYNLFSVDGLDFILINLEYDMPGYAVTWANRILQEHPNRRAIISTHMFITSSGVRPTSPVNRPDGTSAEAVWQQLVFPNCNVFLVLNGHYHGEARRNDPNSCGQPVHQLNADYQDFQNGGDGWLRYHTFKPSENKIYVYTFSPTRNNGQGEFDTDAQSQFVLDYDMQGTAFNVIGSQNVTSGSPASVQWPGLFEGRQYEWFATVSDGIATTTGPTWTFTTPLPTPPAPPSGVVATATSFSSINVTWNDNSSNEETFVIERSINGGSFSPLATVSANTTSRLDTGLSGSTAYCYRVAASNAGGASVFSAQGCATTPVAPQSRTFQNGAGGYTGTSDTHIKEGDPATAFGTLADFGWDGSEINSLPTHGLIRFDSLFGNGAGQVPAGSQIVSATLTYVVFDAGDSASVREVLVNWTESETFNIFGGEPGVQANEIGAGLVGTASGSIGVNSLDVTASVAAWAANPSANRGWIFQPTNSNGTDARSSEYSTVAERPILTILYNSLPNQPPSVNAGGDQTITLPVGAALDGTVTDDGQLNPVITTWSKFSGPGTVTFGNANAVDTSASFSAAGVYVLRLTANDGQFVPVDDVTVTVNPPLPNLLTNPGFESGGTGWLNITHAGRSVVTTQFHSGLSAAQIVVSNTYSRELMQSVAVTGNTSYTASGWVKTQGIAGGGNIVLEWRTAANAVIRTDVVGILPLGTVDWTQRSATFTSPANAASVVFMPQTFAEPDNVGTVWFDDLLLTTLPPANQAPTVSAGTDQTITFPAAAALNGTVTDDGLPNPPGAVTTTWSQVSGPGTVTFGNASTVDTSASFSVAGSYVLRLTAADGAFSPSDDVTITVNPAPANQQPVVNAGNDQTITFPAGAALDATVTDDGLPNPPAAVTTTWAMFNGPGTVTFGNASAVDTSASFSVAGSYVLRLTAADGAFSPSDDVTITVNPAAPNQAPSVSAGGNQTITLPAAAALDGTVTDDGLLNPVTTTWSPVSGPGTVTFGNVNAVDTSASFSAAGVYVLRLTANDGQFAPFAEVTVTVNPAAPNLLTNPGFESGGTGWLNITHAGRSVVTTQFHSGLSAAQIVVSNTYSRELMQSVAVTGNTSYTASGWVKTQGIAGGGNIVLEWRTAANAVIRTDVVGILPLGTVDWTQRSATFTSPANAASVVFMPQTFAEPDNVGTVWFDDLLLTTLPPTNQAPTVSAGTDQTITFPAAAALNGTVTDDGLPNPPGAVTTTWSQVSGPGTVTFGNASAVDTSASFSVAGSYVLRLTAADGAFSPSDDVTITVNPAAPNQAPSVSAGGNQTITLPAAAALDGTVTDDGLLNPVTTTWSPVSGPGTVTFGNVNAVDTSASFSAAGVYVLRLTANDGQFAPFADVTVTVNPPLPNLLTNPGFESGGTGWLNITHAGRSVVTTQFHSGLSAAQIVVSNTYSRELMQSVAVTGNTSYTASGWVKTQGIAGGGNIVLEWRTAANAVIRTDVVGILPLGTVDWTQRSATFTSPANAASVVFMPQTFAEPDNVGTVWFDDLLLKTP